MIHIISRGSKYFLECPECGCKFTFELEDMGGNQHDGPDVKCPQCENTIYLKYKDGRYLPL